MHLVQILLPLRDDKGRGFPKQHYDKVATVLTNRFGGVTAYTRTPAEGRWKEGGRPVSEDDVVVFEVMVEGIERRLVAHLPKLAGAQVQAKKHHRSRAGHSDSLRAPAHIPFGLSGSRTCSRKNRSISFVASGPFGISKGPGRTSA